MQPSELRRLLAQAGLRPSKRRGQHFMTDDRVLARMVDYASIHPGERVLEIGAGYGALTEHLAAAADTVLAVENDRGLLPILRERVPGNVEIIAGDILAVELPAFDVCVSNIPYQLSSPIIFKLLGHAPSFRTTVLTVQLEFAKRLVAQPGTKDYSRLSVAVGIRAACSILERVPRSAFTPPPAITSAIVRLDPFERLRIEAPHALFEMVLRTLFQKRRKMIRTALKAKPLVPVPVSAWRACVRSAPFGDRRVETLSIAQLDQLTQHLATCGTDGNDGTT